MLQPNALFSRPTIIFLSLLTVFVLSCQAQSSSPKSYNEETSTLLSNPCEGCEAVFEYGDQLLDPIDTLPDFNDPGLKLKVTGTIYEHDGTTPAEGIIMYIHHTNQEGVYPPGDDPQGWEDRHGYIRGWIKTGPDGRFTFYTLKPASYPNSRNPAHIHPFVIEPNGYYYLDAYHFADDPFLSEIEGSGAKPYGGVGIVSLTQEGDLLVAERDIILGKNLPGYPE